MGNSPRARRRFGVWLIVLVALLVAAAGEAAYLRNVPQTVTQPDGTVLHLFATGDEYYNWLHDASGYVIVRDPQTGYLVYAVKVDGRLQPSGIAVGEADPGALGLEKGVKPDPQYLPAPDELFPAGPRHPQVRALAASNAPAFSHINNIVIFIRFADESGASFQALGTYQMWFNAANSKDSSMRWYFLEASYGQLTVDSSFYPTPSGTTVVSYQDTHPRSYYRLQGSSNPDGYTEGNRGEREHLLLKAAVDSISSQVPPGLDLDNDNDGFVDNVVFVVSGSPDAWANLLWPHRWSMRSDYPVSAKINGKVVDDYNFQLDNSIAVGVLCHEMTHTLGAPDLYHYDTCSSAASLDPVGRWDLMSQDTNPPQHTTAYLKFKYMGWIANIPLISTSGTYSLHPLTSASNNCYKIASPNSMGEYFVVEYRKRSFPFEQMVPGDGLLVYRIRTGILGNSCGPPDELYVYRPDGTVTLQGNLLNAYFASTTVPPRTAIDDTTNPSSFLSTGYPGGLSISNVGAPGDTISFTVTVQEPCTAPGTFNLTSPANGASVPSGGPVTLSWTASAGATSYDVYFGTGSTPPLFGNQTGTSVSVSVTDGSSYFWKVVAKNSCGETAAPASGTWAFSAGGSGGITLFSDDFESGLSKWRLGNTSGASATAWGAVSCKTKSGNGAAWCAAGGSSPQTPCTQYAPKQGTFLIAGPFSLADATEGTWDFDLWADIDDGGNPDDPPDVLYWMWSLDGRSFYGEGTSGKTQDWEHVSVKMSEMTMGDDTKILGQPKVYFAFVFLSDATTQMEGAYVDNVVIQKVITPPAPLGPKPRKHLPQR
jgi:M6 family metalloprotease-like protein